MELGLSKGGLVKALEVSYAGGPPNPTQPGRRQEVFQEKEIKGPPSASSTMKGKHKPTQRHMTVKFQNTVIKRKI